MRCARAAARSASTASRTRPACRWLGLVVTALGLVALPIGNGWSRHVERQADAFALRLTGNAPAFIAAMQRLASLNLAESEPHPVKEFFLYSHPSIGRRVRTAQAAGRPPL